MLLGSVDLFWVCDAVGGLGEAAFDDLTQIPDLVAVTSERRSDIIRGGLHEVQDANKESIQEGGIMGLIWCTCIASSPFPPNRVESRRR